MFNKILIANRGEIACRVMETAQKMGVSCVPFIRMRMPRPSMCRWRIEAVHIGGAAPAESYLKGDVIIQAARWIPARRRSIRAMAFCPKTPISWMRSRRRV